MRRAVPLPAEGPPPAAYAPVAARAVAPAAERRGSRRLIARAAVSIAAIYLAGMVDVWVALAVLVAVMALWAIQDPYDAVPLLFPALIPLYSQDTGANLSPMRVATLLVIAGMALRPVLLQRSLRRVPRYIWAGLGLLAIAAALSVAINGPDSRTASSVGFLAMRAVQLIVVFVGAYTARDARILLAGWLIFGALLLVDGIWLFGLTGSVLYARLLHREPGFGSVMGTLALVSLSGTVAAVPALAAFSFAERARTWAGALVLRVVGAGLLLAAIGSGRRQGLVSDVVVAAVLLSLGSARRRLLLAVILVGAVVVTYQGGPLREFLDKRESLGSEFGGHGTGRMQLALAGYAAWLESPWFGHGPGSHRRIVSPSEELRRYRRSILQLQGVDYHNSFVGALVELGVFGFAAMACLYGGLFWHWRRVMVLAPEFRRSRPQPLMAAIGVIATGVVVTRVYESVDLIFVAGLLLAWLVLAQEEAAAASAARQAQPQGADEVSAGPRPRPALRPRRDPARTTGSRPDAPGLLDR